MRMLTFLAAVTRNAVGGKI